MCLVNRTVYHSLISKYYKSDHFNKACYNITYNQNLGGVCFWKKRTLHIWFVVIIRVAIR